MSRNWVFVAFVLVGLGSGVTALAQETRPRRALPEEDRRFPATETATPFPAPAPAATQPPARGVRDDSRRAMDEADAREQRRRRVNDEDWFRDGAYRPAPAEARGSVNGEFPSAEVNDFVIANARAATARMMFRRAESALGAAVRQAKRSFENSEELNHALANEKDAYANYELARLKALKEVVSDPKYQAILSIHEDLGNQIVTRRREMQSFGQRDGVPVASQPDAAELLSMANLRLTVASDARAMERAATNASEDLRRARAELMAAAKKVIELRHDFDNDLREDPDLLAARRVLEDARVSRVTAAAYLQGSRMAAEEATDFAYFLHRYDNNVQFDPYFRYGYRSGSNYGYGYGSGIGYGSRVTYRQVGY